MAELSNNIIGANKGYGIDFNPVADRGSGASFRLISSNGDNYAIYANTGNNTVATSLTGMFTATSYTNTDASKPSTAPVSAQLYNIDSVADTLSVANSGFNSATLATVGKLGLDVLSANSFDIDSNGVGYDAFNFDDGPL